VPAGPSLPYPRLLSCAPLLPTVVLPTGAQGDGVVDPSFLRWCGLGGGGTIAGRTFPLPHHHWWHLPPLARPSPRPCPPTGLSFSSALACRGVVAAALRHRGCPWPS
jgi:hypothetical protein